MAWFRFTLLLGDVLDQWSDAAAADGESRDDEEDWRCGRGLGSEVTLLPPAFDKLAEMLEVLLCKENPVCLKVSWI